MEFIEQEGFYIQTALKKPFDPETRFLDMDETLVLLRSRINDPQLKKLDIVGLSKNEVDSILGIPIHSNGNVVVYGEDQHVVAVQYKKKMARIFQYLYLKYDIERMLNSPDSTFLKDEILAF